VRPIILDFANGKAWKPGDAGYEQRLTEALARAAKTRYHKET
jgi:hypothetical protein